MQWHCVFPFDIGLQKPDLFSKPNLPSLRHYKNCINSKYGGDRRFIEPYAKCQTYFGKSQQHGSHCHALKLIIPKSVQQAMKHMEQQFMEDISLDTLAELTRTNKYHLSKEFKRYTGFSPHDYLIWLRINQAKILLKTTNLPATKLPIKWASTTSTTSIICSRTGSVLHRSNTATVRIISYKGNGRRTDESCVRQFFNCPR